MMRRPILHRRPRGVTLIELMVSIAIGLFIVLAVSAVMVTQENIRRNATSGSDSTANAAVGMLILERSIRNGGYGLSSGVPSGLMATCTPQGVSVNNSARSTQTFTFAVNEFAPVVIGPTSIPPGDTNTQVIRVTYGGNHVYGAASLNAIAVSPSVRVASRAGLNSGDLVVLGQASLGCIVRVITALPNNMRCSTPADLANSDVVQFAAGNFKNDYGSCAEKAHKYNVDGTLGGLAFVPTTAVTSGMRIYNLGDVDRFQSVIYAVRNRQLVMCNFMNSACEDDTKVADQSVWQPLVDDVVSLRAQYGIDTNADDVVDTWTSTTPTAMANGWDGTRAIRLAVTTRSKAYNKDEVVVDMGAGKNSPVWVGGDIILTHLPDWKNYRYTVNETTVVLKNAIWKD